MMKLITTVIVVSIGIAFISTAFTYLEVIQLMLYVGFVIAGILGSFIGVSFLAMAKTVRNEKKLHGTSSEVHKQHTRIEKWGKSPSSIPH